MWQQSTVDVIVRCFSDGTENVTADGTSGSLAEPEDWTIETRQYDMAGHFIRYFLLPIRPRDVGWMYIMYIMLSSS